MSQDNSTNPDVEHFIRTLNKRASEYNQALGAFVSVFSMVEANIQTALWKFAGVPSPTAQAVFSGVRVDGAIQFINRISDAQKWDAPRKTELQYVFSRLGIINRLRNDILHYGAEMQDTPTESWLVTNKQFVHLPDRIQETRITPAALGDATYDLIKIMFHLTVMAWGNETPAFQIAFDSVLKDAWHYKPPPPSPVSRKTRKPNQKQPRQPHASQK